VREDDAHKHFLNVFAMRAAAIPAEPLITHHALAISSPLTILIILSASFARNFSAGIRLLQRLHATGAPEAGRYPLNYGNDCRSYGPLSRI
jgi:hypothetical protein